MEGQRHPEKAIKKLLWKSRRWETWRMGGFCIYSEGVANRIGCGVEKKGGVKEDSQGFWSTARWNFHLLRKRK